MTAALLLVDMQNSFLHPEGENYYPQPEGFVDNVALLLNAARSKGSLVVHTIDRHRPGFTDFESKLLPPHCLNDEFNAEYFNEFGPSGQGNEIEIVKRRYSAFFATELSLFLNEQSVDKVVICGLKTNVCVRATVQDAFAYGFNVHVVREATSSNRSQLAESSLEDIDRYFGQVISMEQALDLLT